MNTNHRVVLLLIAILLGACSEKLVPFSALEQQVGKPPLRHVHIVDQYQFTLDYVPSWSVAGEPLKALQGKGPIREDAVAAALRGPGDLVQFILSVGPRDDLPMTERKTADIVHHHPDRASYSANLNHLMYGLNENIYLVTPDGRKVPVGLYHLDRNWGMGETNRFMLQFARGVENEDLAKSASLELVLQHLHPQLVEVRLQLNPNPVAAAEKTAAYLARCLAMPEPTNP